jgi:arylformamidase
MTLYDITLTINPDMPVWPGDPVVILERVKKIEEGSNANVSRLDAGVHTGTHVDAPCHFIIGAKGIDELDLNVLVGAAQVVELAQNIAEIDEKVIRQAGILPDTRRILFKTRNSQYWAQHENIFQTDFVGINLDGARALVQMGIQLVGIDYLSIAPFKRSRPTHEVLLSAGMVVVEGLDLSKIKPAMYQLYCLPIKLDGSDGAPARAILIGE